VYYPHFGNHCTALKWSLFRYPWT